MANEQHPGPWRWGLTDKVGGSAGVLEDANGRAVIRSADNGQGFMRATASAAALIAAAPEMATLLRWALSVIENYGEDEGYWPRAASRDGDERIDPNERMKSIADLLARIDEAGK